MLEYVDFAIVRISIVSIIGSVETVVALPSSRNISLSWYPPTNYSDDGVLNGYNITCSNTETNYISFVISTTTIISPLKPFTEYECCISAWWPLQGEGPPDCYNITTMQGGMAVFKGCKLILQN